MLTIRLSGKNYYRNYGSNTIKRGNWSTDKNSDTFDYCVDNNCNNLKEHEFSFDGQVFFKKRKNNV